MSTPNARSASTSTQPWPQTALLPRTIHMKVTLAFVEHRVNVYLHFGGPVREIKLDRWRRVAVLAPGSVSCRVKWIGNDYGNALWQLMVLQAPITFDDMQRVTDVSPGARILLRADGKPQVKAVLEAIDAIEATGIEPCDAAATFWRTADNRLAARQPLPAYAAERHAAHLAREALR